MTVRTIKPTEVRSHLLARQEIALLDLRSEALFAADHPLFAAQLSADRIGLEVDARVPRRDTTVVLYDDGQGVLDASAALLEGLGYTRVYALQGDLEGWRKAGFELFQDVNSYSKAFGELVESRRHTPSLSADELHALLQTSAKVAVLDARRFDEYHTMSIPTSTSVPGAELVLRVPALVPDEDTTIIVNCAGRTRSIIGTQSLLNAGVKNKVFALRNGTIGWTLAGKTLETGQLRRFPATEQLPTSVTLAAQKRAREVAYRAGVRRIRPDDLEHLRSDSTRTLYRFDVRTPEEFAAGRLPGFRSAPGGQLVQETDMVAPVRGARIVLADDLLARADMSASWLAQMGWEVYVLEGAFEGSLDRSPPPANPPKPTTGRYKRPYEGTDNAQAAMQAYLDWEYGLVDQLARDGTHGFFVI
jgi:rhodanese-related sulfurtransferase